MSRRAIRLMAYGVRTEGRVIAVKKCWWIKINTKPARLHSLDGAVFPHIITYVYKVGGMPFIGKRYVSYAKLCPSVGAEITVYFDPARPKKSYAVI